MDKEEIPLDWKDYVAFTLAFLQTVLLPFILFIAAVLILVFLISVMW